MVCIRFYFLLEWGKKTTVAEIVAMFQKAFFKEDLMLYSHCKHSETTQRQTTVCSDIQTLEKFNI